MKKREILLVLVLIALDQLTKYIAAGSLTPYTPVPVIPGFFYLTLTFNTGAAWSMLEGQMWFFYLVSVAAIGIFVWFLVKEKSSNAWERWSLLLMLAGTIGNFIDRLAARRVRDFLDFYIFGYNFPVFNVADMELTIGAALLILSVLIAEKKEKA